MDDYMERNTDKGVDFLSSDSEPSLLSNNIINANSAPNTSSSQSGSIIGDLTSALGFSAMNDSIELDPNGKIDPSTFEYLWKSLP